MRAGEPRRTYSAMVCQEPARGRCAGKTTRRRRQAPATVLLKVAEVIWVGEKVEYICIYIDIQVWLHVLEKTCCAATLLRWQIGWQDVYLIDHFF